MLVYDRQYRLLGSLDSKTRMPVVHLDGYNGGAYAWAKLTRTTLTTEYGAQFHAWVLTGDAAALRGHPRFRPFGDALGTLERTVGRLDLRGWRLQFYRGMKAAGRAFILPHPESA